MYALGMHVVPAERLGSGYAIEAYNALTVIGVPRKNPMQPIIWLRNNAWDNGRDYGVMKINARQELKVMPGIGGLDSNKYPYGTTASVVKAYDAPRTGTPAGYFTDRDGELAYAYTESNGLFTLHRLTEKGWTPCAIDLEQFTVIATGDTPGELIVEGPRQEGKPPAIFSFDTIEGRLGDMLYQDDRYELSHAGVYRDPASQKIVGLHITKTAPHTVWFDEAYAALQKRLNASFPIPNTVLRLLGGDKSGKRLVVDAISDTHPYAYYQIDLEKGQIGLIKSTAPWLDPKRMRPMQTINYKTRDGFRIEGYLTLPEGASKEKPAPLVVLPHGGPNARDVWGFDREVQFLASRGYAVFQPNYRGSLGYEWQFPEKTRWDFLRMHDDVTDGVKALFKTGLIDRDRVAIMGGSFGGYLALSGASREPDLYRCAITVAGVFDWAKLVRDSRNDENFRSKHNILRRQLGDPAEKSQFFDEISPLNRIANVKIPIFVTHGKDDLVADVSQSRRLVSELEKHGVTHEKLFVGGEGHGFAFYENRVKVYAAIETFLARNLAPRPAVATAAP
jgi:dipeptidyl aminopeptidase/acylaminoacyl peptidase